MAAAALDTNTVAPGFSDKPFQGALAPGATSVAIGLSGDQGYWVMLAQPPNPSSPTFPGFAATLAFAPTIPPGPYQIVARAPSTSPATSARPSSTRSP